MGDDAWGALRLLGRLLWDHGLWAVLTSTLWGLLFAVLGLAVCLLAWVKLGRRGWLDVGIAQDGWIRGGVLALWLLTAPTSLGTAGLIYGAERATLDAIAEERMVAHACRGAATSIAAPVLREAAREAGIEVVDDEPPPRVLMQHVWALRGRTHEMLDAIERSVAEAGVATDDSELTADTKRFIVTLTLDRLRDDALGGTDASVAEFLRDVEHHAQDDGTVGVEDFVGVLAADVLEPHVNGFVSSIYASFRTPIYLTVLVILVAPFGIAWLVRWARRRRDPS